MADDGHDIDPGRQRLVVALVRGVHGLRGAVRVEVLTDRPEARFVPGAVLFREGTDQGLTIVSAEAVQDGPGWRVRFQEITSREGADTLRAAYLETEVRPTADLARGEVYWHEVIGCPVRGLDDAELGVVKDIYRVAENEVFVVGDGPVRDVRRPGGPGVRPDLRPAPRGDRRGRRGPRPAAAQGPNGERGSSQGAPTDLAQARGHARTRRRRRHRRRTAVTIDIDVLTLFPSMVVGPLAESIPGRIQERGLATIRVHDLRQWGLGRHRSVDDTPYGGGAGMVMRVEPVVAAIEAVRRSESTVILLDPGGETFSHARAVDLAFAIPPRARLSPLRRRR